MAAAAAEPLGAIDLPQRWTLTRPPNLRRFSEFGGSLVRKRTATFCSGPERVRSGAAATVNLAADRDNFRDKQKEI
jgi:hypothetical protein